MQMYTFLYGGLLLVLYNYSGFAAPRLSLHNFWFHFTWFVFVFWVCFLQLFRTPCAWQEDHSANLRDLAKTWPTTPKRTHLPLNCLLLS